MHIYLDHNATTPVRPAVIETVAGLLGLPGNASSVHAAGRAARAAVEEARAAVAALCGGVEAKQVIFTSGATEANNTVIKSFPAGRVITGATEHPSVIEAAPARRIRMHASGLIDMGALESLLKDGADLVSVMWVNNETGVIQPVAEIGALARRYGARFHCDAVQAAGRLALDMGGIDYMTVTAHKLGGPQGAGAIVVAPGAPPVRLLHGGGQERRQRAGTENVAGIAGFGVAARLALANITHYTATLAPLRARIEASLPGIAVFGADAPRVANTTCFALPGVPADTQLMALDLAGFCVSSGSACSSGTVRPSHVLEGMGVAPELAACALRVSLGWNSGADDVERFIETYGRLAATWRRNA